MILLTLVKKEVVQFFRNKYDVVVMLIFPLILIFIMGKCLDGFMGEEKNIFKDKIIYYKINTPIKNEHNVQLFYDFMIHFQKDTKVSFVEIKNYKKATEDVNKDKAICFLHIYDNNIKFFRNEKKESSESKIFRNLYEQYIKKYSFLQYIYKSNPKQFEKAQSFSIKTLLKNRGIDQTEINSYTYYTFAILVLIILYISTITCISMYKERFLHTMTRLKVSNANKINIFLSKIILGIVIGLLQISIIYFYSTKFLNVNWGENLNYIFLVLIGFIIFSSVLGIFISMIFSDKKTAYIVNNILIIIMGFLGGSYVPICLIKSSKVTSFISQIMPSYYVNISLFSLSYNIKNQYCIISLLSSIIVSIVMLVVGVIISKKKAGVSFD